METTRAETTNSDEGSDDSTVTLLNEDDELIQVTKEEAARIRREMEEEEGAGADQHAAGPSKTSGASATKLGPKSSLLPPSSSRKSKKHAKAKETCTGASPSGCLLVRAPGGERALTVADMRRLTHLGNFIMAPPEVLNACLEAANGNQSPKTLTLIARGLRDWSQRYKAYRQDELDAARDVFEYTLTFLIMELEQDGPLLLREDVDHNATAGPNELEFQADLLRNTSRGSAGSSQ